MTGNHHHSSPPHAVPAGQRAVDLFQQHFHRQPEVLVRAPGRVNLLGGHIDYSEGWVLPAAIDRALWMATSPTPERRLSLWANDMAEAATVDLDRLDPPVIERDDPTVHWWDYLAGVARALAERGQQLPGLDLVITSDIPVGAGLSSSAALEMAFLLTCEQVTGVVIAGPEQARIGQQVENHYIGVQSGVMDQYACLHGRQEHLILLDCRSLEHELLPVPAGTGILVADSRVRRRLANSEYGDRRQQCTEAVRLLRSMLPDISTLRDVSVEQLDRHQHHLPQLLQRRARHAVEECRRVCDGAAALRRGDLPAFGQLMRQAHRSSRDLYEVSIPELDLLAETAWETTGCFGARLAGGGFGGCVVVFGQQSALPRVEQRMSEVYERRFGQVPLVYSCRVADGAQVLQL